MTMEGKRLFPTLHWSSEDWTQVAAHRFKHIPLTSHCRFSWLSFSEVLNIILKAQSSPHVVDGRYLAALGLNQLDLGTAVIIYEMISLSTHQSEWPDFLSYFLEQNTCSYLVFSNWQMQLIESETLWSVWKQVIKLSNKIVVNENWKINELPSSPSNWARISLSVTFCSVSKRAKVWNVIRQMAMLNSPDCRELQYWN